MSASPLVCLLFLLFVGRHLSVINQGDVIQDVIKTEMITTLSINNISTNKTSVTCDVTIDGASHGCPQICAGRIPDK